MLLTVIIVTKNPGDELFPTLSSLMSLNSPAVEILIKDNSDNKEIGRLNETFHFANFRYVHSSDEGIYDAMNQALKLANGEFIYFLNAGDIYMDCDLLTFLKNDDGKTGYYYGNIISLHPFVRMVKYPQFINKYSVYLRRICHQGIIFKKNVFDELGEFDINLKTDADYLFILRLADQFKGKPLKKFLAIYKGGGFSYGYKQTAAEKKYLQKKMRDIFHTPEIWLLSFASVLVSLLVYLKNINKPT